MAYDCLKTAPSEKSQTECQKQYARGTRAAYTLAAWMQEHGWEGSPHGGPEAGAVTMIPAAIEAGLGELGKHGSMITRKFGSSFRLSGGRDLFREADCSRRKEVVCGFRRMHSLFRREQRLRRLYRAMLVVPPRHRTAADRQDGQSKSQSSGRVIPGLPLVHLLFCHRLCQNQLHSNRLQGMPAYTKTDRDCEPAGMNSPVSSDSLSNLVI